MHSPRKQQRANTACRWLLAACITLSLPPGAALAAGDAAPSEADVAAAVEQLRADPNLATERTTRVLRWAGKDKPKPESSHGGFKWLSEFMGWLAQTGRVIVWLTVAVLAAVLVLLIARMVRSFGPRSITQKFATPTHVRDLDIRPESLPDDIGAAALDLWMRGEHRAALSLLYRGLLSRLVHGHELPIRHSTTEGDCMALAQRHLTAESSRYVTQLVRTWQLAVYGGSEPRTEDVQDLCNGFAAALATPQSQAAAS